MRLGLFVDSVGVAVDGYQVVTNVVCAVVSSVRFRLDGAAETDGRREGSSVEYKANVSTRAVDLDVP